MLNQRLHGHNDNWEPVSLGDLVLATFDHGSAREAYNRMDEIQRNGGVALIYRKGHYYFAIEQES
jgi:hypothetical protein